ncbi:hypothetical protein BHM03_00010435 [Ensete ventricosum]|uniref:Uncharacterized protein n=1 Tax=Ensete ventricosum TaxID=4639 RepID=A0A445MCZ5_ENSVE|nr:hypothetical protein BHM03_00010435 [Ensete ventricosum]
MTFTLIGFTGDAIAPLGVTIPVTIEESRTNTLMVPLMVVKLLSAYNAIIGHPTLNKLRAVVSMYHCTMKFTSVRVGATPENQDSATWQQQLFLTRLKMKRRLSTPGRPTTDLPPKVVFPTLRVKHFEEEALGLGLRENLDLIEELRAEVHLRALTYRKDVARLYNYRVRS